MAGGEKYRLDVDGVLCISLKEREDRRKLVRQEFAAFDHDIEFVLAERDTENPERGCYESHRRCASIALERGYKRVLILEDDATFLPPKRNQIKRINQFLKIRDPKLFYLGGMLGRMWLIPWPSVVRCRLTGTQAYILSQKGCERLLKYPYFGKAIDGFYCRYFKAYGTYPMLSQQQPESLSCSDIMAYRSRNDEMPRVKDTSFWEQNYAGQVASLRRNWLRTLAMRFF